MARSALFETLVLNPPIPPHAADKAATYARIPSFLYGCAWKKERTSELVCEALQNGFRGIDVAAQPRHYREDLVGDAIRKVIRGGMLKREDLFIQTKYTSVGGQDPKNMPYDPNSSITSQVHTSIQSSLHNLRVSDDPASAKSAYLDSLVLHSPLPTMEETLEAWRACESYVPTNIRHLGISNTTLPVLRALWDQVKIKPAVVQNRFHRATNYEISLRDFCRERGVVFQSFWTLTANEHLFKRHETSKPAMALAKAAKVEPAAALYGLVMGLDGIVMLNGTQHHMAEDIDGLRKLALWTHQEPDQWKDLLSRFKQVIGESGV